jgi:hypothetical protein
VRVMRPEAIPIRLKASLADGQTVVTWLKICDGIKTMAICILFELKIRISIRDSDLGVLNQSALLIGHAARYCRRLRLRKSRHAKTQYQR